MTDPDPASPEPVPETTADGSATLWSPRYRQSYHSRHGAAGEARHVYLELGGVAARLMAGRPTAVLEVGFGAALNFLLTADLARVRGGPLRYLALERELLPAATLASLGYDALLASDVAAGLLAWRRALPGRPPEGRHGWRSGPVAFDLLLGDAAASNPPRAVFDAVYHDPFSPEVNPELWTEAFLAKLRDALRPGGRLTSYSVQGAVRRRLQALGFRVERHPGPPGGKREVLLAVRP